jgi:hypothetical protein
MPNRHHNVAGAPDEASAIGMKMEVVLVRESPKRETLAEQARRETHRSNPAKAADFVEEPQLAAVPREFRPREPAAQ